MLSSLLSVTALLLLLAVIAVVPRGGLSAAIDPSECGSGLGPLPVAKQRVFAEWFNNTAFAPADSGRPYQSASEWAYQSSLSWSLPADAPASLANAGSPLSFQAHGHILAPLTANYSFRCAYSHNRTMDAKVWIDDHLLCPEDLNNLHLTLPFAQGGLVHVRVEAIQNSSWDASEADTVLSILWSVGSGPDYVPIPASNLVACLPSYRLPQHALHAWQLQTGWDRLLHSDLLTLTLLPHGLAVTVALYQMSTAQWQTDFTTTRAVNGSQSTTPQLRIGNRTWVGEPHSPYQQVHLTWQQLTIAVESTVADDGSMALLVTGTGQANWTDYRLLLRTGFIWGRTGECSQVDTRQASTAFASCTAAGISPSIPLFSTALPVGRHLPGVNESIFGGFAAFAFPVSSDAPPSIAFTSAAARSLTASRALIDHRLAALPGHECASPSLPAELFENCNLLHASLAWLTIFNPYEGIFIVQTRDWDFGYGYVLFEWDSYLVTFMLTMLDHPLAKRVAVSTYLQVTKTRTTNSDGLGFVPNFASGTIASRDRTEPPLAALALGRMLDTYGWQDPELQWLVPLCYPDLLIEMEWFWRHRRIFPLGLIGLGSDPNPPTYPDIGVDSMWAATLESGMDNSPMYDDDGLYDGSTHTMRQYDVGFSSLYVFMCNELLRIHQVANVSADPAVLAVMEYRQQYVSTLLSATLWDPSQQLFVNRRSRDLVYSDRRSPTSFYPMMVGVATVAQAELMVGRYLTNDSEFCVSATCTAHPLPSISRVDANYADQNYWRGRQWGPHSMLVYLSLSHPRYADSGAVQAARAQLAEQVNGIWPGEWRALRHVHENYDGEKSALPGCNSGNSFPLYAWGALNAAVPILHAADTQQERQQTEHRHRAAAASRKFV